MQVIFIFASRDDWQAGLLLPVAVVELDASKVEAGRASLVLPVSMGCSSQGFEIGNMNKNEAWKDVMEGSLPGGALCIPLQWCRSRRGLQIPNQKPGLA